MTIIDADKFLAYLIYSKHIDGLTCGEVKEAVEMCKVDVLEKIRTEISDFEEEVFQRPNTDYSDYAAVRHCLEIIDKYKAESEETNGLHSGNNIRNR